MNATRTRTTEMPQVLGDAGGHAGGHPVLGGAVEARRCGVTVR